jgi:hypothetical protein
MTVLSLLLSYLPCELCILSVLYIFFHIHSFHWHMQNATIPCHSQELLLFPLTAFCHLPLTLVVSKFIYNTVAHGLSN